MIVITLDTLANMKLYLTVGAYSQLIAILTEMSDYVDDISQASITEIYGGPVCLIEHVDELTDVQSAEQVDGKPVSLAECGSSWFDIAEWIDNGNFARFATINSNEGGSQYLIPRDIAELTSTVRASIEMTAVRQRSIKSQLP